MLVLCVRLYNCVSAMVYCILVAVSEEDSIMYYTEDGTDWSTYNNNSFVPVFTDNIDNWVWPSEEVKTEAYNTCGNDTFCIYDIYVTEDLEVGKSSKVVAETSAKTNDDLSMWKRPLFPAMFSY